MLGLDDLAADRLPPDLDFDTNGARIIDLPSMLLDNVSRHPWFDVLAVGIPAHFTQPIRSTTRSRTGEVGQVGRWTG